MIKLSQKLLAKVMANASPEMDYHIVSVVLHDGSRFDDVVIDDGYITKVAGSEGVPFSESDIDEIIAPYDKWVRLPSQWATTLTDMPESGMGYTFVKICLNDEREFKALITSGFITKVQGHADIPFSAGEIKSITFSHVRF